MKNITAQDICEFEGQVVDIFEDWLDNAGYKIPNQERDADDPDSGAEIWGDDYDLIADEIDHVIREPLENGTFTTLTKNEADELINTVYNAFIEITKKNPSIQMWHAAEGQLRTSVRETFEAWGVA